jgi:lipid-binding SYLF domain-containing protein
MLMSKGVRRMAAAIVCAVSVAAAGPALADEQELVDNAAGALKDFLGDPDLGALRELLPRAKAVMIVPDFVKAGFIIGGAGGDGVVLAKGDDGTWSHPAFFDLAAGSIGFQIGASEHEIVFVFMTSRALGKLLDGKVTVGADVSVAAGPTGAGVGAQSDSVDVYSYVKSEGAYLGVAFNGGKVEPDKGDTRDYYDNKEATAKTVLMERRFTNPGANGLLSVLAQY